MHPLSAPLTPLPAILNPSVNDAPAFYRCLPRLLRQLAYLGSLLVLLSACQARNEERCVLLDADFEQFEAWGAPIPPFLTKEQAHSGHYSFRLPQGAEYGGNYVTTLGKCATVPRRLRLSGWVYLPNGRIRSTVLVVQVLCHGRRPDVWEGLELSEKVKRYQTWESVEKYIRLPEDLNASDELKVYVWHADPNGEIILFDDLKVEGWR